MSISITREALAKEGTVVLHCPFCGLSFDPVDIESDIPGSDGMDPYRGYAVLCVACGARGPVYRTVKEAIEAWSATRYKDDAPPARKSQDEWLREHHRRTVERAQDVLLHPERHDRKIPVVLDFQGRPSCEELDPLVEELEAAGWVVVTYDRKSRDI